MKVAIKAIPAEPRDTIKGGGAKYAVREVRDIIFRATASYCGRT